MILSFISLLITGFVSVNTFASGQSAQQLFSAQRLYSLETDQSKDPGLLQDKQAIEWAIEYVGTKPKSENSSKLMVPASVTKIVTTAAALKYLGKDYRFKNTFHAELDPSSGIASDLHFEVSGDPSWNDERMNRVSEQLIQFGIKKVVGKISVTSLMPTLDQIPRPSAWPDRWALECMANLPNSFIYDGNCGVAVIHSKSSAEWITPGVEIPIILKLKLGNVNHYSIGPHFDEFGKIKSYTISGIIRSKNITIPLPVHSGMNWLKKLMMINLKDHGITYSEESKVHGKDPFTLDLSSAPLIQILIPAVQNSWNYVLDRVFYELPTNALLDEFKFLVDDSKLTEGLAFFDGSGLNRNNRVRSDAILVFLERIKSEAYFQDFFSTLAVSGKTGTLENRLTETITFGKIFGKTGTLDGVNNLVGYYLDKNQNLLPFSVLTEVAKDQIYNNQIREMIDKVVSQFAEIN